MNSLTMQMRRTSFLLICMLSIFAFQSRSQCTSELGFNDFPFTKNGITISQTTSGNVQSSVGFEACGVTVKDASFWIGYGLGPSSITFTFSAAISSFTFFTTASNTGEAFVVTPGTGTATLSSPVGCYSQITGNQIRFTSLGGATVEVTGSTPFTTLTIAHNGIGNGSLVTFCGDLVASASAPAIQNVTGGGAFCAGTDGKGIGLDGSESGVNYQLQLGALNIGSAIAGTGSAISFGLINNPGTYTVVATRGGISKAMTGSAIISETEAPTVTAVALNPEVCKGSPATLTVSPNVVYVRGKQNEPWGRPTNPQEFDAVFGTGKWSMRYFEDVNAAALFTSSTATIMLEGSDGSAGALKTFLTNNKTILEDWVNKGGQLFLNAAPNMGGNIDFGFGGVTLNYPAASGSVSIAAGKNSHPIFVGPFPCGVSWTGGSFSHASLSGGGIVPLITGPGTVMAEKSWGAGKVIFGGMTLSNFHQPAAAATNLRKNILSYLKKLVPQTFTYKWSPSTGLNNDNSETVIATPLETTVYTLTATNEDGCSITSTATITVKEPVVITLQPLDTTVYAGKNVHFETAASGENLSYQWQVNEGSGWANLSGKNQAKLELENVTSEMHGFQYRCVVSGSCPAQTTNAVTLAVLTIVPQFSIANTDQCISENSFTFTNTTLKGNDDVSYTWDFGDGSSSKEESPVHQYTTAGAYTVVMTAETTGGFTEHFSKIVNVYPQPQAKFAVENNSQCLTDNKFEFINSSLIESGLLNYAWEFGDGRVSSEDKSLSNTYGSAGVYSVKLEVTSEYGCADSLSQSITVSPMPEADFMVNLSEQCLAGNKFILTNTSSITKGTLNYRWDFDDATTAEVMNSNHVYASDGNYNLKLVAESAFGCKDSTTQLIVVHPQPEGVIVSKDGTDICEGSFRTLETSGGSSYQWFMNGKEIAGANLPAFKATEKGVYSVKLVSEAGCETMASNTKSMEFRKAPIAAFSFDKYCQDVLVKFDNKSVDNESGPVTYAWSFGNGLETDVREPSVTFSLAQEHTVRLSVVPQLCPELAVSLEKKIGIEAPVAGVRYPVVDASQTNPVALKGRELPASVEWTPASGLSDRYSISPVLTPTREQDFRIRYSFASGCTTTDSLLVRVFEKNEIFVPKAFTPNGDGRNDILRPINVGIRKLNFFRVYNRWGNLLYETKNINEGWDGTLRGAKQGSETYIWSAEAIDQNGKLIRSSGSTTLIR